MPIYEYRCRSCDHEFETLIQGSARPVCPGCGGKKLEKKLSVFAVSSAEGRESSAELPESCRSCGIPGGPGACGMK
jgi:putative FmdB family regulatory protein